MLILIVNGLKANMSDDSDANVKAEQVDAKLIRIDNEADVSGLSNVGGVVGYPLPCSGIFVAGLFDDRYTFGADARILYPVGGTATNANFEVLGRFGMFSPVKRFSSNESVFL